MEKKNDKKIFVKYLVFMFISLVVGGAVGYYISSHSLAPLLIGLSEWLQNYSVFFFILPFTMLAIAFIFYSKGNKQAVLAFKTCEDEPFEKADCYYGSALNMSGISSILNFTFFAFATSKLINLGELIQGGKSIALQSLLHIGMAVVFLFVHLIIATVLQHSVVNATKKLYPEKLGNTLDFKFQKDWYSSCDEAERQLIGNAAYKSYVATCSAYPFAFLACIVIGLSVNIGVIPYIIIGVLWLITTISYMKEVSKQNKKRKAIK